MATPRPLKLAQESYRETPTATESLPVAEVLVRVPTSTIEDRWDYLVPSELDGAASVGQLVTVPFGSRTLEGYILNRRELTDEANRKFISAVISSTPPLSISQLALLETLSDRYAANASDFLETFLPPFSKAGENHHFAHRRDAEVPRSSPNSPSRELRIIPQNSTLHEELLRIINGTHRRIVIVFPELSQIETFAEVLTNRSISFIALHSNLKKSERYEAYLSANSLETTLVLGLRSASMLSAGSDDLLVIVDDSDSSHYEQRSPTWNSRDVALLRSQSTNIIFLSHAPSLELTRLHSLEWLPTSFRKAPKRKRITADGEGVESSYRSLITESLRSGSVLVIHNAKGHIRSFTCSGCRNIALCDCGGKLTLTDLLSEPTCSECSLKIPSWKCRWCGGAKPRIATRGMHQSAKEFAQHYPQIPVIIANADHRVLHQPSGNHLIFSTIGCEPIGVYQAIIFLGADREYSGVAMRSQERARSHWAKLLTLLHEDGTFYLQMPRDHVAIQELLTGNPFLAAEKEIDERNELHLPPYFRLFRLVGSDEELRKVLPALQEFALEILGPFQSTVSRPRVLIKVEHERARDLLQRLSIVNRLLQTQGRELLTIHCDPSELS